LFLRENANLGWVQHIWQEIEETSNQLSANLKLPFLMSNDREGFFKRVCSSMASSERTRRRRSRTTSSPIRIRSMSADGISRGVKFSPKKIIRFTESTYDIDYDGQQNIGAFYMMADVPIGEEWNVVGGFRFESTSLTTEVYGDADALYLIPGIDPATGQPYNLRAVQCRPDRRKHGLSRVERPTVDRWRVEGNRKDRCSTWLLANRCATDLPRNHAGSPAGVPRRPDFIGNPLLTMASLDNYDVRLDYTPVEGFFLSGSIFYKELTDTIEYSQFDSPQGFVYTSAVNYPTGSLDRWRT
jgi:hypothetical protein